MPFTLLNSIQPQHFLKLKKKDETAKRLTSILLSQEPPQPVQRVKVLKETRFLWDFQLPLPDLGDYTEGSQQHP